MTTIFHKAYKEASTGNIIDGDDIRIFLDWTPEMLDKPRYAKVLKESKGFITYLDSELIPVE